MTYKTQAKVLQRDREIVYLATELSRLRALTDDESEMLERAMRRSEIVRPRSGLLPVVEALVLRALVTAAESGDICPTADDLTEVTGLNSVSATVDIVRRLEKRGLIRVDRFQRARRVTIVATGKRTADPTNTSPHWRNRLDSSPSDEAVRDA